jgi:hypothetical protein
MSRFLLKRDDTSVNAPAPEQVAVGELVLNSKTGKLYTKLVSGDMIEYIGSKVCFSTIPTVKFYYEDKNTGDIINNFCCAGGMLFIEIEKLKTEPADYSFSIVELTNNTTPNNIIINTAEYSVYTENSKTYRKAILPISISVNPDAYKNISIFKFNIFIDSNKLSEHLITIQCIEALS